MQEMLKITGIRKSFSTLDVLKGVDLTVHKGEVVSLICLLYTSPSPRDS